jgi:hypothetical protein
VKGSGRKLLLKRDNGDTVIMAEKKKAVAVCMLLRLVTKTISATILLIYIIMARGTFLLNFSCVFKRLS